MNEAQAIQIVKNLLQSIIEENKPGSVIMSQTEIDALPEVD